MIEKNGMAARLKKLRLEECAAMPFISPVMACKALSKRNREKLRTERKNHLGGHLRRFLQMVRIVQNSRGNSQAFPA